MDDRALLELAAKAAGYRFDSTDPFEIAEEHKGGTNWIEWNPLAYDGDALRLAVKLRLLVNISHHHTEVRWYDEDLSETHEIEQWDNGMTPEEWTRRAIVRAAASLSEKERGDVTESYMTQSELKQRGGC